MTDAFYTPEHLAESMIRLAGEVVPETVADFSAGDGALLNAATSKWPDATVIASDFCDSTVRRLRSRNADWLVTKVDFSKADSRSRSKILVGALGNVDLALLNPPFSCRGGKKHESTLFGEACKSSLALSFVIHSCNYLSKNGQLISILPASTLGSEKDSAALDLIKKHFVLRIGVSSKRGEFDNCHAKCVMVKFTKRKKRRAVERKIETVVPSIEVRIIRGSVPLHLDTGRDRTLVHSTDLVNYGVVLNGHVAGNHCPSIVGPCVLVHRVGLPKPEKIAVYKRRKRVALSDCVIGIQCESANDATWLHKEIQINCTRFLELYKGTCAPYITINKLRGFLTQIGCSVLSKS